MTRCVVGPGLLLVFVTDNLGGKRNVKECIIPFHYPQMKGPEKCLFEMNT